MSCRSVMSSFSVDHPLRSCFRFKSDLTSQLVFVISVKDFAIEDGRSLKRKRPLWIAGGFIDDWGVGDDDCGYEEWSDGFIDGWGVGMRITGRSPRARGMKWSGLAFNYVRELLQKWDWCWFESRVISAGLCKQNTQQSGNLPGINVSQIHGYLSRRFRWPQIYSLIHAN